MAKKFAVYSVRQSKTNGPVFWNRVGFGVENKDGSLSLHLDAIPVDGKLHVRPATQQLTPHEVAVANMRKGLEDAKAFFEENDYPVMAQSMLTALGQEDEPSDPRPVEDRVADPTE